MKQPLKSKRSSKVSDRITNSIAWGPEPKWTDKPLEQSDVEIRFALNWYNFMSGPADQMKWTLEYLRTSNQSSELIKQVAQLRDAEIHPAGSIFRMALRGARLPIAMLTRSVSRLEQQVSRYVPKPVVRPKLPAYVEPVVENAITTVESVLERIRKRKFKTLEEIPLTWAEKLTTTQLKAVAGHYQTWIEELQIALDGTDPQITEGYAHYKTPAIKQLALNLLAKVLALKPISAQRPAVPVPPHKVIAKVLFNEHDPETDVASIDPELLVGANKLWVWNARTRRLGVYVASNGAGLTVHRTTMQGHNVQTSVMKVLRRPKEMLAKFMRITPEKAEQFFHGLATVAKPMNDRLSRDIVLLKAIRS